jgi:DHA1 family tetracycline resistance protein-like MFS transporter
MAVGFSLQAVAASAALAIVAIGLVAIGAGLSGPALSAILSRSAPSTQQGSVLGVSQSLGATARVLGPLTGTFALAHGAGAPYAIAAATMAIGSVIAIGAIRQPSSPA